MALSYTAGGSNRGLHLILKKGAVERTIWTQFPVQAGSHSLAVDTNTGDVPVGEWFLIAEIFERTGWQCVVRAFHFREIKVWTYYAFDVVQRSGPQSGPYMEKPADLGRLKLRRLTASGRMQGITTFQCVTTGDPENIHTPNTYCTGGNTPPIPLANNSSDWTYWDTILSHSSFNPYHRVEDSILGAHMFYLRNPLPAPCGCSRSGIEVHGGGPLPNIMRDYGCSESDAMSVAMRDYQPMYITHGCIRLFNADARLLAQSYWAPFHDDVGCFFLIHVPY
mgnify:CR=1 FL=1